MSRNFTSRVLHFTRRRRRRCRWARPGLGCVVPPAFFLRCDDAITVRAAAASDVKKSQSAAAAICGYWTKYIARRRHT